MSYYNIYAYLNKMQRNIIQIQFSFNHRKKNTKWLIHTAGLVIEYFWLNYALVQLLTEDQGSFCIGFGRSYSTVVGTWMNETTSHSRSTQPSIPSSVVASQGCFQKMIRPDTKTRSNFCTGYPDNAWWSVTQAPSQTRDSITLFNHPQLIHVYISSEHLLNQCKLITSTIFYSK